MSVFRCAPIPMVLLQRRMKATAAMLISTLATWVPASRGLIQVDRGLADDKDWDSASGRSLAD